MSKAKAFDYVQVPLAIVATDLTGASVEVEGAYFRLVRLIAVNGPMDLASIRRKIGEVPDVEHALDDRSADEEPLLSFSWLEEWRERANAARVRLSKAGTASAEKRASKKARNNVRSTNVEQANNDSSTNVEQSTILYSTINKESRKKERAIEWPKWAGPNTLAKWEEFKAYKLAEKKERYKSSETEQRAVNLLAKWFKSGQDCVDAIDEAMGRGWLFPVDPAKRPGQKEPSAPPVILNANGRPQQLKPWVN